MTTHATPQRLRAPQRAVDGPAGNARLTAWAGSTLIVLLAVEGLTLLLGVRQVLSMHVFVGTLLIGPVVLKLASTGYRFVRYYTRNPEYVRSGPPKPLLRMLAPFLVVATVALLGSGVGLILAPASWQGPLRFLHSASFAGWIVLAAVHVLAYLPRLAQLMAHDLGAARAVGAGRWVGAGAGVGPDEGVGADAGVGADEGVGAGRGTGAAAHGMVARVSALGACLAFGLVLAALLVQRAQPWLQLFGRHHHH
jgi:hypothetical protein